MGVMLPDTLFYILVGVAGVASVGFLGLGFIVLQVAPAVLPFAKAKLFKRPVVFIHTAINSLRVAAPKREGKKHDGNMLDLGSTEGVKFVPEPRQVTHYNDVRVINYYTKAPIPITPRQAAACNTLTQMLQARGIEASDSLLDTLILVDDEALENISEEWLNLEQKDERHVSIDEIKALREELRTTIIKDGEFTFQTVQQLVMLAQTQTARSLSEYTAIAEERAAHDAALGKLDKDNMQMVMYLIMLLIGGAVAWRMIGT
jgi:ribosomal protein L19E